MDAPADPLAPPPGRRERNRRERARAYLDAAMAIAGRDGIGNLTMARLADAVDAAVGTVYTYFPSKAALVAELQREAIERITEAYRAVQAVSEADLAGWGDHEAAAVARLQVFGRFWVESVDALPQESAFLHALISDAEANVPEEEHHRVLPAAMALLDEARAAVETAVAAGVVEVGDPMDAVIRWASALTGCLLTSNLAPLNPVAFDGRRLARHLQHDLLLGWGAPRDLLERAEAHADALAWSAVLPRPAPHL